MAENDCEQLELAEKDYESEVLTEIKLPAKKINFIYQKRLNTILNLLSDSSSSMEAESRLLNLCRCFNGLRGKNNSPLATMTRKKARSLLLKMAQQVELGAIINEMLRHGVTFEQAVLKIPEKERPQHLMQLFKYVPFYDGEGLLRIGGRLQNSDMSFQIKHPILLPFRHWTTELYIKNKHTECGHFGPDFVFGSLHYDSGLWAIGGTATVRHYIKDCQGCRLRRQKRGEQLMAPLPASRLKPFTHVFTCTASDLAGPFNVVVGRSTVTRWLCIIVCMVTMAVRIEVAADLTTSSFMNVFRRFLCSIGFRTKFMRTDNGTNYVGANNLLKREVQMALTTIQGSRDFKSKMDEWEVEWEFGTPEASHHGGIYERQIRNLRKALAGFPELYLRNPIDDDILTCCKMAEYIINCRPLTKSPSDDGLPPLRPIDLMVGAMEPRRDCAPPCLSVPQDELRRGYRFTKRIAELWWERWCKIYLSGLQERKKWRHETRDFKIGDLVILCNEDPPRFLQYPYAVIKETIKGSDGRSFCHSAYVRWESEKKRHNENGVGGHGQLKTFIVKSLYCVCIVFVFVALEYLCWETSSL